MYSHPLKKSKTDLIDLAFASYPIRSLLDLGACWGVHGGYTFHALEQRKLERAFIVDGHITDQTRENAKDHPQLTLIQGALGDLDITRRIGQVDAVIMYDILEHQVAPDWDQFLAQWGKIAKYLIIYNQSWSKSESAIRFVDMDADWYIANVPHGNEKNVRDWYNKLEQQHPEMDRKWRDVHYFWQFGIPLSALKTEISRHGYAIDLAKTDTPWSAQFPWVTNDMVLASRV